MYSEKSSILKHLDFIICDFLCMEIAFIMSFYIRHKSFGLFDASAYRAVLVVLVIANITSCVLFNTMKDVLKRSKQLEFYATLKQVLFTTIIIVFFVFITKTSEDVSRNVMVAFPFLYFVLSYIVRLVYKRVLLSNLKVKHNKIVVIIATYEKAKKLVDNFTKYQNGMLIKGIVLLDNFDKTYVCSIPVVATKDNVAEYLRNIYVDEVFILNNNIDINDIIQKIDLMGLVMHMELPEIDAFAGSGNKLFVENIVDTTFLTSTLVAISPIQYIVKRIMDIVLGIIGSVITIVLTIIIGPIIKMKSKGPIFFIQNRVGRNGKIFKMIKFRSMVVDADELKEKLKEQNENKDGMMFKMENDPRIIKGIGDFIRKTSIDEFPQFINVLFGDMSVVGTRPPTIDEWEKYDLHHRARLAIKPGITGLWQVSGRSNIKSFEDVVKLDVQYIKTFSLWLDFSIIFKTIKVVFNKEGAK